MAALVSALASDPPAAIVFGALGDKAWEDMLGLLRSLAAPRFYVAPGGRAPAEPAALAQIAPGATAPSVESALAAARAAARGGPVLVCGSLYLVGAARARLLGLALDPIVAL
jgi:dihydrofolate synthase/folylpolyglutamate synthase